MNQFIPPRDLLLPLPTPDKNSYSIIIRDGILARLKKVPLFQSTKKWSPNKARNIQNDSLPYVGVYFVDEQYGPDGDTNAGAPHFKIMLKLGFQVLIQHNDPDVSEHNLDAAHWAIMSLWQWQDWHRFAMPAPFEPVEIESIDRGSRSHWFGNSNLNVDIPIAELRQDLTFCYRAIIPPIIPDYLKTIHETVAYPWPYDPGAHNPEFTVQYDFLVDDSGDEDETGN